jgi:branched-chain amino acid transport system substrate-binding protein
MNFTKKSALAVAAFAAAMSAGMSSALAETLKIAAMVPLSGASAATGQLFQQAMTYVVDKYNEQGGWNGEPVELVFYDTEDNTGVATNRFQQAAAEGMHIIAQGGSSAVAASLSADVERWNRRNKDNPVLSFTMGGEAADLTGKDCHFHHFRFATTAAIRVQTLVEAMSRTGALGDKVYSINQDYSWGQEMQRAIEANADKYGYEVAGKSLHATNKLGDFSPYALQIKQSGAETVVTGNWSRDLLLLAKAIAESGVDVNLATVYLDQPGNIAAAGNAAAGNYIAHVFNADSGGKAAQAYMEAFKSKAGVYPVGLANNGVISMEMLTQALTNLPKQDEVDVNKIALALENTAVKDWPMGELRMRAQDHQLELPLVVSVVSEDAQQKVDGTKYGFKPVALLSAEEVQVPPQEACKMKRPK